MEVWEEQNNQAERGVAENKWKKLTPEKMELADGDSTWNLFSGDGKKGNPYKIEDRWTFTDVGGKIGKDKVKGKEYWVMKIGEDLIKIVGKDNAGLKGWNNINDQSLQIGLAEGDFKITKG
jgi:hypothetical protein